MWARNYGAQKLSATAAVTTTSATPTVYADLSTYADLAKREIKAIVSVGAFTTVATMTFSILECATTGGTYAAPTYGTTETVVTTANTVTEMNFRANHPYVKLGYAVDATGSVPLSAVLVALKREA